MTIRTPLQDILRISSGNFDAIRVVGDKKQTTVEAVDANKTLFLVGKLKQPIPEFSGDFGIGDLRLLAGLVSLSTYEADGATIEVKRHDRHDAPEKITFKDARGKNPAVYRFMSAKVETPSIANVPWDLIIEPSRSKIAEFTKISDLYSKIETVFSPVTEDGDLLFKLGSDSKSTHHASMTFSEGVEGKINAGLFFESATLLSVLKLAGTNNPVKLKITNKAVMGVEIETDIAVYTFFLRAQR